MFSDEVLEPVEFKSTWKKERSLADSGVQTNDLVTKDRGSQSVKRVNQEIQTDEEIPEDIQLYEDDSPELLVFLRHMEPLISKELRKNCQSHAFDGYSVRWEEETNTVSCLHTLTNKALTEEMPAVGLSWNCTGSVIAVAYGRTDHEDWCNHRSALCTWNLDRRKIESDQPNVTIDQSCCLMCVAFHPIQPSWIAGGTFNGEVIIWDVSNTENSLIASSGIGDDSHREPVSKLHWITDPDSKGQKYHLVSVGCDGRILIWQLYQHQQAMKLVDGFVLLTESLPRQLKRKGLANQPMGISCISFNHEDETSFLIGSQYGGIYRCSTQTKGTAAGKDIRCSIPLQSPVGFTFAGHKGPVYAVDSSPYHRNLFLSSSTDGSIRIYSVLEKDPLLTLEPNAGHLFAASWSPVRPPVVAVGTGTGQLYLYDLRQNRSAPVIQLDASAKTKPVYSLEFNQKKTKLLATGDGSGCVMIWKLNDDLTEQTTRDQETLDDIANIHHD